MRRWVPYLLWFALGVPWYWPFLGAELELWLGMPRWAAVSVLASLGVSVTIAWQLRRPLEVELSDAHAGETH